MFADLHLHTRFSDGTYSPEELVSQAKLHGLAAVALTDHDTVEGCAPTAPLCEAAGILFIAGTELTAEQNGNEIHVLGYLLDTGNAEFLSEIEKFQVVRQERVREMVARLNRLGMPSRSRRSLPWPNCRSPGRPHVARALVAAGLCRSLDEAFERFLKKKRPPTCPNSRCRRRSQSN